MISLFLFRDGAAHVLVSSAVTETPLHLFAAVIALLICCCTTRHAEVERIYVPFGAMAAVVTTWLVGWLRDFEPARLEKFGERTLYGRCVTTTLLPLTPVATKPFSLSCGAPLAHELLPGDQALLVCETGPYTMSTNRMTLSDCCHRRVSAVKSRTLDSPRSRKSRSSNSRRIPMNLMFLSFTNS